ncbi:DUF4349 domain-containing protein [Nocardia sp. NBC_00416]|uniref:DUF4349 domain-containing protein n=1 Tax=Nocardia sp. NBC_00416 TaxID=2975991 RepID=UPI002E1DF29F
MRKLGVLFVVVCGSVLLAGCGDDSRSASGDHSMSFEGGAPAPATAPGIRVQKAPSREQAPSPAPDTADQAIARKEVVTGTVDLTAADPVAAAQTLADRVSDLDGRIDQRTENPGTADTEPHADLIIRIPAADTDAFIDGLADLGELTQISTNRDDVTLQWQDLDARITALRASVDRLRDLMARAVNTADLIAAEGALADRQAELDSLTGQRRYLDDQISLSTLTIDISSPAEVTGDTGPSNFWDGIVDGWNSLFDWLQDAVVFVGRALPWLAFLAILGAIVGAVVGLFRRRASRGAGSENKTVAAGDESPGARYATVRAGDTSVNAGNTTADAEDTTADAEDTTASAVSEPVQKESKSVETESEPAGSGAESAGEPDGPAADQH